MKKALLILLALVMLFPLAAGGSKEDGTTVRIGVFEPASGDNGAGGKQETLGIQYANSLAPTVDIDGTTYNVELVIVDNESSNDRAATAASDPFQGTVLANYAYNELGARTAYCLAKLGDDYSGGLVNYFIQQFKALGGTCISETFPDGNSDFTSYVNNAKNSGAEVFFSPVSTEAAQLIIDQSSSQGLGIPILAGDTWDSNVILQAAKGKSNVDITVTTFYPEGANPEFDAGFQEWVNADSTRLANNGGDDTVAAVTAMGFDAYNFALQAIKNAGSTDPADVMEALWTTETDGVTGHIALEQVNGDAIRNTVYVKHCNTDTGAWDALPAVVVE